MNALIAHLTGVLRAHRRALFVAVVVSLGLAGLGASRFEVHHDITGLLKGLDSGAGADALEALARFGAFDVLLVDVSHPTGGDPSEMASQLAERLQGSGAFTRVLFELDVAGLKQTYAALFERRLYLLPPPTELGPGLAAAQRDLMTPLSMMVDNAVARDPLDQRSLLLQRLESLAPQLDLDTTSGRLMSRDRQHALLVVEPRERALDVQAAQEALRLIRSLAPPEARTLIFGPHVFASSSARSIRRDVHVTLLTSVLAVVLLFAFVLRRVSDVWLATLPVGVGALWALGLLGGLGQGLHGITLGFGAVMLGIGIDYGVHIIVHFRDRRARMASETVQESMQVVLRSVGPSVLMGALTTLVAFVTMLLSGTQALHEMVLFCGLGLAGAFLFAVLVLPPLLEAVGGGSAPLKAGPQPALLGPQRSLRIWPLAVVAGLSLVALLGVPKVRFDGDIRKLDYQPPEVRAVEAEIFERYAPPVHPTLVVLRGKDEQEVLRRTERAVTLLQQGQAAGQLEGISAVTTLIPSIRTQRAHLAAVDSGLEARLQKEAPEYGLRPAFFEPFYRDLAAARAGVIQPLAPGDLAGTPFEPWLARSLKRDPTGVASSVVVHTGRAGRGAVSLSPQLADNLRIMGATVVSGAELAARALVSVKDAVLRLSGLSLLAVGWLLLLYYRRPGRALLALLPAALGLAWTAGAMGLFGISINIVSVGAFALVSGVGVDYGIFVTDALVSPEAEAWPATLRSVRLAAGTTLLGFASLLLADSPVMWSLGFAVSVGVLASLIVAVWGLRGLYALGLGRDEPSLSTRALLALGGLCALSLTLALTWIGGARSTHGAEVLVTLGVNVACAVWIVRRARAHGAEHG